MSIRKAAGAMALGLLLSAASVPAGAETVSAGVAKALIAAKSFYSAGNYAKAMAAVHQAEIAPGKTAHDQEVIDQMRAAIASRSGDKASSAAAYERLLATASGPEALTLMHNLAALSLQQQNYPKAIYWVERYNKSGGNEPAMKVVEIQARYRSGDYAAAARMQQAQIAAEARTGKAPPEEQLQLLYDCQRHLNDKAGQFNTIRQLVLYYPKPDYWLNIIDTVRTTPGFADRLQLDLYRLEFSLGLVNKPSDAVDYATLAVQAGLPGEAKYVVDKSFAGGLLGTGPEAARHQRLKALVDKTVAAAQANMGKQDADAASDRDGNRLLAIGETDCSFAMWKTCVPMIREAISKDQLRHPEDAKLALGYYEWAGGDKKSALATLRTVGGSDGTAQMAQLWTLRIQSQK